MHASDSFAKQCKTPDKMQPNRKPRGPTMRRGPMLTENPAIPTATSQDLADVERVLAGEVRAFEGIVRRWQGPLVNMAWRYTRDRGRAEELAQEAFVRAWRGLAGWRREGSF